MAEDPDAEYNKLCQQCSVIARPLAKRSTHKKLLKLCKLAASGKQLKRGVKEVVKSIRKKQKGLVILAGDVSPVDVITHIPVLCEDNDIPYIYVPSKETLGSSALGNRASSCMLVLPAPLKAGQQPDPKFPPLYEECQQKLEAALQKAMASDFK